MSSAVTDAIRVLHEALFDDQQPEQQAAAAQQLGDLVALVAAMRPRALARVISRQLPEVSEAQSGMTGLVTAALLKTLYDDQQVFRSAHWLHRLIQPRWSIGGELRGDAPPVSDVEGPVLAAIDGNAIDANGYAAVIIGRYGPEAESVLPALIERLRKHRTDCSRAPGLTWSVYMIGGLRPEIRELMIEIVTKEDSCPHSKKLAAQILKMNQVSI